jgi:hypothetical protein
LATPKRPTITDVADAVGLSIATVSRALVKPEMVSPDTRERVLGAVERLGYQPNLLARDLRLSASKLVFVIVPSLSPFFLEAFRGVDRAASKIGYAVLMGFTDRDPDRESALFNQVASRRADGCRRQPGACRRGRRRRCGRQRSGHSCGSAQRQGVAGRLRIHLCQGCQRPANAAGGDAGQGRLWMRLAGSLVTETLHQLFDHETAHVIVVDHEHADGAHASLRAAGSDSSTLRTNALPVLVSKRTIMGASPPTFSATTGMLACAR